MSTKNRDSNIGIENLSQLRIDYEARSLSYFPSDQIALSLGIQIMNGLRERTQESNDSSRVCLHPSSNEAVNVMLIAHPAGFSSRIKRHFSRIKWVIVLDGELEIMLFDEQGNCLSVSGLTTSGDSIMRIPANQYHSVSCVGGTSLFVEILDGPYLGEELDRSYID